MLRKIKKLSAFNYQLSVIKDLFSCLLSALLLILPFNNGKLWILAWFGFVPLFFTLNNKSLRQAVFLFFITGVFFWSGVIYWLVHVTLAGAIILILYLSLYFAVFGLVIRPFTRCSKPYVLLLIPSTWVLLEYLRAYLLTGFPWALLGYSQYLNLTVIQVSDITGAYGVSFLVMMVNAAIVEIIFSARTRDQTRVKLISALLLLFLLPVLGYGYFSLSKNTDRSAGQLMRIAVVQGNIPQELKWVNIAQGAIINKYLYLTRGAVKNTPDLIIWPEAAVPYVLENTSSVFALFEKIPAVLLFGAVTKKNNLYYNSALLYDKNSLLLGQYNKLHLVPYGEFIPFRGIFPFLEYIAPIGDIEKGKDLELFTLYSTYSLLSAKFSVLICFEDLFPELSRKFIRKGAGFLVNITNDAWYKRSSASEQHFQASVFRAVENRVFVVRSANTGVSGFIDPYGRFTVLDKFNEGYLTKNINLSNQEMTFYTRYGDLFAGLCGIVVLLGTATIFYRRRWNKK